MNNALEAAKEITKRNRELTQRVMDYFLPLRKRFVTKSPKQIVKQKKFLWFKWTTYDYIPLRIDVASTCEDKVYVRIHWCVEASNMTYIDREFPIELFEHNNYYISNDDGIKSFIHKLISVATPKYVKYEAWVNHIEDEELKYDISNELEKLFDSEEFKALEDSDQCHEMTIDLVKRLEKENEKVN